MMHEAVQEHQNEDKTIIWNPSDPPTQRCLWIQNRKYHLYQHSPEYL